MKRIYLLITLALLTLNGCVSYPYAVSYQTVSDRSLFHPLNNVITVANNTSATLSLTQDGSSVAVLEPGEIYTLKLHNFINGAETTLTAVSENPPGMKQQVFYLSTYGIQSLPWKIDRFEPRKQYYRQ